MEALRPEIEAVTKQRWNVTKEGSGALSSMKQSEGKDKVKTESAGKELDPAILEELRQVGALARCLRVERRWRGCRRRYSAYGVV